LEMNFWEGFDPGLRDELACRSTFVSTIRVASYLARYEACLDLCAVKLKWMPIAAKESHS
jgi:hypothetical protein